MTRDWYPTIELVLVEAFHQADRWFLKNRRLAVNARANRSRVAIFIDRMPQVLVVGDAPRCLDALRMAAEPS